MSAISDTTFKLFMEASLADEDLNYPAKVSFVSADLPDADAIVWRNLHAAGTATVIITGDDTEIMLVPCPRPGLRGWVDHIRGTVMVQVMWRHHKFAPYSVRTRMGKHPLADMRRPAVCA